MPPLGHSGDAHSVLAMLDLQIGKPTLPFITQHNFNDISFATSSSVDKCLGKARQHLRRLSKWCIDYPQSLTSRMHCLVTKPNPTHLSDASCTWRSISEGSRCCCLMLYHFINFHRIAIRPNFNYELNPNCNILELHWPRYESWERAGENWRCIHKCSQNFPDWLILHTLSLSPYQNLTTCTIKKHKANHENQAFPISLVLFAAQFSYQELHRSSLPGLNQP
jgi:hypothetical protein